MNKLYCDGSFDWTSTEKSAENVVRGKIAISDGEQFNCVEKVAIGKVPNLKQYINIIELFAIGRAIELSIINKLEGDLSIFSDSSVAVIWARKGKVSPKVKTEAHSNVIDYLKVAFSKYPGQIKFNFIPREQNPAGFLLDKELTKESPHTI